MPPSSNGQLKKWEKDPVDSRLEFNLLKHYHLGDFDNYYLCSHCMKSKAFYIERKNPKIFKCVNCQSLIEVD